jgi:hypothetical protein
MEELCEWSNRYIPFSVGNLRWLKANFVFKRVIGADRGVIWWMEGCARSAVELLTPTRPSLIQANYPPASEE